MKGFWRVFGIGEYWMGILIIRFVGMMVELVLGLRLVDMVGFFFW